MKHPYRTSPPWVIESPTQKEPVESAISRSEPTEKLEWPLTGPPSLVPMSMHSVPFSWTTDCQQQAADEARDALQVILGGSEILIEDYFDQLPWEPKRMLAKIIESGRRLSHLIDTLTRTDECTGVESSIVLSTPESLVLNVKR